jgi:nitrate/nitrite transport system substrate-binding protein
MSSKDVTLKVMGMDSMIKALETNEIDAFINPEPLSSLAVSKGLAKDFILTKDLWFRHPCCCLTTRRTLFENESNLFQDFVTATLKSSLEINDPTSRELKLKMIWKRLPQFQQLPFGVIKSSFTPGRSDFEPFPYQSSARVVAKLLQKNGLISQNVSVEEVASEIFLSDYTRNLMESIQAAYIPSSNDKEEKVVGRSFN